MIDQILRRCEFRITNHFHPIARDILTDYIWSYFVLHQKLQAKLAYTYVFLMDKCDQKEIREHDLRPLLFTGLNLNEMDLKQRIFYELASNK